MKNNYLYIVVGTILLILFVILQPSVQTYIFPLTRKRMLQNFVSISKQAGSIDPQLFWKTREYYAPGYMMLDKDNIDPEPFLTFQSKSWKSLEILTESIILNKALPNIGNDCQKIIFRTDSDLICVKSDGSILIAFIKDQEDMRMANVFYDPKHDEEFIKGKNWLVISQIQ